jgi:hypothetical protein
MPPAAALIAGTPSTSCIDQLNMAQYAAPAAGIFTVLDAHNARCGCS